MKSKFDKDTASTEADLLSTHELANLANSSRSLHTLFQPLLNVRKLLHHVVHGEHVAVATLLRQDIDLLFKKGIVTDLSGRTFDCISAFEYVIWALDKHMWDVMLSCIPQNEKGNKVLAHLRSQYNALPLKEPTSEEKGEILPTKGITYRLNGKKITEPHFSFEKIIQELQIQVNLILNAPRQNWDEIDNQWVKGVGGAQRLLPMHVVNEYCATRAFQPIPDFTTYPGSSKQFYHWKTRLNESWFDNDFRLDFECAISRGWEDVARGGRHSWLKHEAHEDWIAADLAALKMLCKIRTHDFINLATLLEERIINDNQPLTPHI